MYHPESKAVISVILPCLNEAQNITETITAIRNVAPDAQILVIDNGSTDETVNLALKSKVEVIHEPRRGKGYAVKAGIGSIKRSTKVVFMVDADDTYGLENLKFAIDQVVYKGYDMVVGNRKINFPETVQRNAPFRNGHILGNRFFTWITRLLHPAGIQDTLSGWRVMSTKFLFSFPGGFSGFEIESELNAHAHLMGSTVLNVDVSYQGRKSGSYSKLKTYHDGLRILLMALRTFRNDRPQVAFGIISIPWLLCSIYFNYRAISNYVETGLVSQFPSLIAGIGTFVIFSLLVISGIILERVKQVRVILARYLYQISSRL